MQPVVPKLLDVVALLADRPSVALKAGDVGTIVEFLGPGSGADREAYLVEFSDDQGRTVATETLERSAFLVLLNVPAPASH